MIRIKQAIVVEGKYDKIKLSSVVDAPIIVTNGFSIFKDKQKLCYINEVAKRNGIIILTDSDNAGLIIRNRVLKAVDKGAEVINAYIPDIFGKERRKKEKSAEGKLGVEGIDVEILKETFKKFGVISNETQDKRKEITKNNLFELGLSGGKNSAEKRKIVLKELNLPENLTTNNLLEAINILMDYNEFINLCERIFN